MVTVQQIQICIQIGTDIICKIQIQQKLILAVSVTSLFFTFSNLCMLVGQGKTLSISYKPTSIVE